MNKKIFASVQSATPGLALFLAVLCSAPAEAQKTPILFDRIVAVVGDEVVTYRELATKAAQALELSDAQASATEFDRDTKQRHRTLMLQTLEHEVEDRLIDRELKEGRDKLGVLDKDIDKAIAEVMRQNRLTHEQLEAALYGQGLSFASYRIKLRQQIERARLVQARVQGRVQIREGDVVRLCAERGRLAPQANLVCASHLLLRLPENAPAADVARVTARAEALADQLEATASFDDLVQRYNEDTAAPDGKLGCFGPGEMTDAFEQAALELPIGQTSRPVRTSLGVHIIRIDDRPAAEAVGCKTEEDLAPFRQELYEQGMQSQMTAWVAELRHKAAVEVRLDAER